MWERKEGSAAPRPFAPHGVIIVEGGGKFRLARPAAVFYVQLFFPAT